MPSPADPVAGKLQLDDWRLTHISHNCQVSQDEWIDSPWSHVDDREKKVQESPCTGETRFWILSQDKLGPSAKELTTVSAPSVSTTENPRDVSGDVDSGSPPMNNNTSSPYSGGINPDDKASHLKEYGPVRIRN